MKLNYDVTRDVEVGSVDDENTYITQCVCGEVFAPWNFIISIYEEGTPCPKCGRRFFFRVGVKVFEVIGEE